MTTLVPGICNALTKDVVDSLKTFGVRTVTDFVTQDVETIAQKCTIAYKDVLAIRRVLLAQYSAYPVSGTDAYISACSSLAFYSVGCTSLDQILDGGLYTGEVTEIAGEIAAGKTQLCLSSAASVSSSSQQNVVYIDTCGAFCAERVLEMLQINIQTQEDQEACLSRIQCVQPHDLFSVLELLENIRKQLIKQTDSFYSGLKLIILDSVTAVIYPVLGGQQMDGHSLMVQLGRTLKMLSADFSLAILLSNNVVVGVDGQRSASLGRTWSHVPHTRVILEKTGQFGQRKATVVKSSRLKTPSSSIFTIPTLEPD